MPAVAWAVLALFLLVAMARAKRFTQSYGEPPNGLVQRIARAIAKAEGFYVPGSLPRRRNNPGSITGSDGKLMQFVTEEAGWLALYDQIRRMLTGRSLWYGPNMTIQEIAVIYTGGDKPDAWARIVAGELGVTPSTKLGELA